LPVRAEHSSVIPLTCQKREEIYARFEQIAKQFALDLSICGCKNPEIGGTCNITGEWLIENNQPGLFKQGE